MGTKVVVSVWLTVDKKSENFAELFDRGLLIRRNTAAARNMRPYCGAVISQSTFESLRDQMIAGASHGACGYPMVDDGYWRLYDGRCRRPRFSRTLLRWFEFAVFTPILRMHGDREIPTIFRQSAL